MIAFILIFCLHRFLLMILFLSSEIIVIYFNCQDTSMIYGQILSYKLCVIMSDLCNLCNAI